MNEENNVQSMNDNDRMCKNVSSILSSNVMHCWKENMLHFSILFTFNEITFLSNRFIWYNTDHVLIIIVDCDQWLGHLHHPQTRPLSHPLLQQTRYPKEDKIATKSLNHQNIFCLRISTFVSSFNGTNRRIFQSNWSNHNQSTSPSEHSNKDWRSVLNFW